MIITCENCKNEFDKPNWQVKKSVHNFCSRKCACAAATKIRWKDHVSPYKNHFCIKCNSPRGWRNKSGLCNDCLGKSLIEKSKTITVGEIKLKHKKRKNSRWYSAEIRAFNKGWNTDLTKIPCQKCGYSNHTEMCHIKAIKDFKDHATLGEINNPKNLVILCPNCHWEFDNGVLTIKDIMVRRPGLEPG